MKYLRLILFLWLLTSHKAQATELTPITSYSFVGLGGGYSQSFYLPAGVARFDFETTSGLPVGAALYYADNDTIMVGMVALCGNPRGCNQSQYLTVPRPALYRLKIDALQLTDWKVTITNLDGLLAKPAIPFGEWQGKGNNIVPGRLELIAGQRYKLSADYSLRYGDLDFFVAALDSRGQVVANIYAMPEGSQAHEIEFVVLASGPVWVNVLSNGTWRVGIERG